MSLDPVTAKAAALLMKKAMGGGIGQAVNDYLDAHPEKTTTVEDGSITEVKLDPALKAKVHTISVIGTKLVIE
jgi:hypothetical protein